MRINPVITNSLIKFNKQVKSESLSSTFVMADNRDNNVFLSSYYNPVISFKGFNDVDLLNTFEYLLDATVKDSKHQLIEKYADYSPNNFANALQILSADNDLYEKVTSDSTKFKLIADKYVDFSNTTLDSIDDVRRGDKFFSKFWFNNAKIGSKSVSEIIYNSLNVDSNNKLNYLLRSSNKDVNKIKESLILNWFENSLQEINDNDICKEIECNHKKLAELKDKSYANIFLENQKVKLREQFYNETLNPIFSKNSSENQKEAAFNVLLSYLTMALQDEKDTNLANILDSILKVKDEFVLAKDKESLDFAKSAFKKLYRIAFDKWEKVVFYNAINNQLKKEIFIASENKINSMLRNFQNYPNFDTDEKYFTVKYYKAYYSVNGGTRYNSNDYLQQIINDRTNIQKPEMAIKNIISSVNENRILYFNQLDSFYDLVMATDINPDLELPVRDVKTPNDTLSFVDLYLQKLGEIDNFKLASNKEKLARLKKLTRDDFALLNIELKKDWYNLVEKHLILDVVSNKAREISVFQNMYRELEKINFNLEDIKIKTDNMVFSLKEALSNRSILASQVNDNTNMKLSAKIAQMERDYNNATPEQRQKIDESISLIIPKLITALNTSETDVNIKNQLKQLNNSVGTNHSTHSFIHFMKNMFMMRVCSGAFSESTHFIKNQLAKASFPASMPPDMDITDTIVASTAGVGVPLAKIGAALTANPVALSSVAAVLVATAVAVVASNSASKAEKQQRILDFSINI